MKLPGWRSLRKCLDQLLALVKASFEVTKDNDHLPLLKERVFQVQSIVYLHWGCIWDVFPLPNFVLQALFLLACSRLSCILWQTVPCLERAATGVGSADMAAAPVTGGSPCFLSNSSPGEQTLLPWLHPFYFPSPPLSLAQWFPNWRQRASELLAGFVCTQNAGTHPQSFWSVDPGWSLNTCSLCSLWTTVRTTPLVRY